MINETKQKVRTFKDSPWRCQPVSSAQLTLINNLVSDLGVDHPDDGQFFSKRLADFTAGEASRYIKQLLSTKRQRAYRASRSNRGEYFWNDGMTLPTNVQFRQQANAEEVQ